VASTQWLRAKGQGTFHRGLRMDRLAVSLAQYFLFGTGFATRVPAMGTAFTKSAPDVEAPDLQFYCGGGGFRAHEWFPVVKPPEPDVFGLTYCHLRPESRGEVKLGSADPLAPIKIYNNFFSTEYDRRAMREGMKFALHTVEETKAFAGMARRRVLPGPDVSSDNDIDAFLRANVATIHHPAGTCKIGIDAMAVVDPEFRVRGTEHLRVIDASIIPDPIGGNLNAPVIMIAEKAADILRGRPPLPPADI
jgi:4-pyridoxate dehydrogenase